jgi:hypothetical protein
MVCNNLSPVGVAWQGDPTPTGGEVPTKDWGLAKVLGIDETHLVRLKWIANMSVARGEEEVTTRAIVHALQLQRASDEAVGLAAGALAQGSPPGGTRRIPNPLAAIPGVGGYIAEGMSYIPGFGDIPGFGGAYDVVFEKIPGFLADLMKCDEWCPTCESDLLACLNELPIYGIDLLLDCKKIPTPAPNGDSDAPTEAPTTAPEGKPMNTLMRCAFKLLALILDNVPFLEEIFKFIDTITSSIASALVSDPQKLACKTCAFLGMFDDMLEAWIEQLDPDFCLEIINVGQRVCADWGLHLP